MVNKYIYNVRKINKKWLQNQRSIEVRNSRQSQLNSRLYRAYRNITRQWQYTPTRINHRQGIMQALRIERDERCVGLILCRSLRSWTLLLSSAQVVNLSVNINTNRPVLLRTTLTRLMTSSCLQLLYAPFLYRRCFKMSQLFWQIWHKKDAVFGLISLLIICFFAKRLSCIRPHQ